MLPSVLSKTHFDALTTNLERSVVRPHTHDLTHIFRRARARTHQFGTVPLWGCWLRAREKYDPLVNETREKGERERETRVARRQLPAETAIGIARGGKREREALAGRRRGRSGG